jgi:predicted Kef-type K+ transport protein/Trk K+ transport system NAD-binding subunit
VFLGASCLLKKKSTHRLKPTMIESAIHANVFHEIAAILAIAAIIGSIGFKMRQPLIVSFLAVGILVGPSAFGIIGSHAQIELLANIGISLLLFVVGLKLDLHIIRTVGPVALATGLGQVIFTSLIGFGIALALGISMLSAAYVAVALTFSSTIIIVKLLSDKKEIDSLHGRIAIGFLLVQDIAAILAMIALTALGGGLVGDHPPAVEALLVLGKGLVFLAMIALLTNYVLPWLLARLARSQELLVLFAIAWAVMLGAVGNAMGFSKEVGAFLAGISIASTEYREAIGARLVTLRDFLLLFFFIDLGARLEMSVLGNQIGRAAVFSPFVLIGNPLIVMVIMGIMGYRRRTGFMAGLAVAQISEFSLILGALGVSLGHIDMDTMGLITLVGIVTICASTYMILYSGKLYEILAPFLTLFERKHAYREVEGGTAAAAMGGEIILLGLGNYGGEIAKHLIERKKKVLGVDFDPQILALWREQGLSVVYGDGADPELLDQLPIHRARWIVSTVRDRDLNVTLLKILKTRRLDGKLAVAARDESEAAELRAAGAHVVFRPYQDGAEYASDALTEAPQLLQGGVDWPISLKEMRLRSGSLFAGKKIGKIPLREETGVSILALSRAGKVYFDIGPHFRLYPGDHLILMGSPGSVKQAGEYLEQREPQEADQTPGTFSLARIEIAPDSSRVGRTLADLRFRHDHEVTVVGIQRGQERITSPKASLMLEPGDHLIVVGSNDAIERLKAKAPL